MLVLRAWEDGVAADQRLSLSRWGGGKGQDRQHLRYLTRWPSAAVKQTVKWSMGHSGERSEQGQKWEIPAQRQRFTSGVAGGPQEVCRCDRIVIQSQ